MRKSINFFLASLLFTAATHAAAPKPEPHYQITVTAGDFDRLDTVVSFKSPAKAGKNFSLRSGAGTTLPLQIEPGGQAWFILPKLKKGESKVYQLVPLKTVPTDPAGVLAAQQGNAIKITVGGKPVLQYYSDKSEVPRPDIKLIFRRGGYLHPVYTPSGKIVTDDYPHNHLHHHGLWYAWTKTEFDGRHPDFWNMGEGSGTVEFAALVDTWSGPVFGGFQARHRFVDLTAPQPTTALNESWDVKVFRTGQTGKPFWMFDLVSTQECASATALRLPKYHYGGIGLRGNGAWDGKENTFFLTSEGETDRLKGNETRARWCHVSGQVGGALAGVAILGSPQNFRAPQPMRLHPTEPFFCYAPEQLGDWEIAPGKPYVARYRFIVSDGPPDKAELERQWNDYATPPDVTVQTVE